MISCICLRTGNRTCVLQLFELAHMFELEHMSMPRNIWACTHVRCYATPWVRVGWGVGGVGMMMFFGLALMSDATELLMFFRFAHMSDATELLMFFRACTHVGCYGTADVL